MYRSRGEGILNKRRYTYSDVRVIEEAVRIVENAYLVMPYSCFAIIHAERCQESRAYGTRESLVQDYEAWAKRHFKTLPAWWDSDSYSNRYIPERVEALKAYRTYILYNIEKDYETL